MRNSLDFQLLQFSENFLSQQIQLIIRISIFFDYIRKLILPVNDFQLSSAIHGHTDIVHLLRRVIDAHILASLTAHEQIIHEFFFIDYINSDCSYYLSHYQSILKKLYQSFFFFSLKQRKALVPQINRNTIYVRETLVLHSLRISLSPLLPLISSLVALIFAVLY